MKTTTTALISYPPAPEALPVVRRILHPTDLSDRSVDALTLAFRLALQNHAELILAHALAPPTPLYENETPERPAAESALDILIKKLSSQGIKAKRVLIKGTRPMPDNIAACARFFAADLIVMGSRSRRGLARFLRGSIAASVIRKAACPVLVVRSS